MATYRFELNNKQTRNKKFQVLLCITINGKRKRIKTDVEVNKKSDWNPTPKGDNWIRPSEPNFKVWNQKLADINSLNITEIKKLEEKQNSINLDSLEVILESIVTTIGFIWVLI